MDQQIVSRTGADLMTFPGVSVVIPTVGRSTVRAAVLSALDQKCPPLEVIVVVDTTECTVPPVLSDITSSIRVFFTGGIGASGARMRGVTESRGQFIAFLDDDDTWAPEKLERQLPELQAALVTRRHAVVSCRFAVINEDGKRLITLPARMPSPQERMASYLFRRTSISIGEGVLATPTLMCDRELLDLEPLDLQLSFHEDWDWLLRVGERDDVAIRMCPDVLVNVGVSDARSLSRSCEWSASLGWLESRSARLTARERGDFLLCHTATIAFRSGSRRGGIIAAAQALRSGRPGLAAWLVWGIHMISPRLVDHGSALHRVLSARSREARTAAEEILV
jgi:glycosyltransferase involved in cell wall biosynthesis